MEQNVKQSIEARRSAIFATYEVGEELTKKVEKLFGEIEKLGMKCKDVGEFETEFAKSPLNQQYLDLFTEVATNGQVKAEILQTVPSGTPSGIGEMMAESVVEGVADRAMEQAERAVMPTRAAVHQEAYDAVRDIPVVGDAIDIGQKASYVAHLGKVFGKRKKKDGK